MCMRCQRRKRKACRNTPAWRGSGKRSDRYLVYGRRWQERLFETPSETQEGDSLGRRPPRPRADPETPKALYGSFWKAEESMTEQTIRTKGGIELELSQDNREIFIRFPHMEGMWSVTLTE